MGREPLEYGHRELLRPLLGKVEVPLAEYSFANLYFFRESHSYEILKEGGRYFIVGLTYDKKKHIMPLVDPRGDQEYSKALVEIGRREGVDMLFPIAEEWLPSLEGWDLPKGYEEQDSDYLYTVEKLQHYPGRKLHKKRNLLKQYETLYCPHVEALRDDNVKEPLALLDKWQKGSTQEMGESDYHQCREALEKRHQFQLNGAVFYADEEPAGFMLGEPVSPDVFAIHFAKGDVSFRGVYQFMFNRFAEHFCRGFKEINLEQDMGIEGLRKTKRSYYPDRMGLKYRLYLKGGPPRQEPREG